MAKRSRQHIIDALFTLALFCVLAASALIVVYIGADVYTSIVRRSDTSFEINTTLTFVGAKIRQNDIAIDGLSNEAVRIDYIEGERALVLQQIIGSRIFETWIYHYDGALYEIFLAQENIEILHLGAGQRLIDVYVFEFGIEPTGIITLYARSQNGAYGRSLVSLRSGGRQ